MKELNSVRTTILAGSFLLQLSTLCFQSRGAPGNVDLSFDPGSGVNGTVNAVAVQPDGKVIIGGAFTTVKGLSRSGIARLNADGSGDPTFNPGTNSVHAFALQPNGKLIVCRQSTNGNDYAARLNSDGTLDGSFAAVPGSYPYGSSFGHIVVQPDGKVLLGGQLTDVYVDNDGGQWFFSCYLVIRLNTNGTSDPSFPDVIGGDFYTYGFSSIVSLVPQPDGKVLIGTGFSIVRLNADGSPDNTFNPGTGPNNSLFAAVAQPDGKVLIGGYFTAVNGTNRNGIARLNANGSLDTSFNPGAGASFVYSVGLQPDGKVLISGFFTSVNGTNRNGIARLNANGSLDPSFDSGTGMSYGFPAGSFVVQTDGKMLIGGAFTTVNGANRNKIARLNANGSLDSSFDPGSSIDGGIGLVVEQPDGKALLGGGFTTVNGTNRNRIARLNADGTLDSGFNPGKGADYSVASVVPQANGKVLIGGNFNTVNGTNRNRIARLNADGTLDSGFIPGSGADYGVLSVAAQADGKVLIGGYFSAGDGTITNGITRLNADGTLDGGFHPDTGVAESVIYAVVMQSDGKVLIGGHYYFYPAPDSVVFANLVTRLNSDGSRDTTFEPVLAGAHPADQNVEALAVQSDGKILVGGAFHSFKGTNLNRIARLNADGTLDLSFNTGSGVTGASGPSGYLGPGISSIAVQPDGKLLIGGNFSSVNGTNRNSLARLNGNGSLDSSFNPGTGANGSVSSIALQPDGNVLIAGDFTTVNDVVRPHVARLYGDSLAPSLNIARSNAFAVVSWPVSAINFQLQESTNLSLPNSWSSVGQSAVTNAGQVSVTVPTIVGRRFFRLK